MKLRSKSQLFSFDDVWGLCWIYVNQTFCFWRKTLMLPFRCLKTYYKGRWKARERAPPLIIGSWLNHSSSPNDRRTRSGTSDLYRVWNLHCHDSKQILNCTRRDARFFFFCQTFSLFYREKTHNMTEIWYIFILTSQDN